MCNTINFQIEKKKNVYHSHRLGYVHHIFIFFFLPLSSFPMTWKCLMNSFFSHREFFFSLITENSSSVAVCLWCDFFLRCFANLVCKNTVGMSFSVMSTFFRHAVKDKTLKYEMMTTKSANNRWSSHFCCLEERGEKKRFEHAIWIRIVSFLCTPNGERCIV